MESDINSILNELQHVLVTYDPTEQLLYLFEWFSNSANLFRKHPTCLTYFLCHTYRALRLLPDNASGRLIKLLFHPETLFIKQWARLCRKLNSKDNNVPVMLPGFTLHICKDLQTCYYSDSDACGGNIMINKAFIVFTECRQKFSICVNCYKSYLLRCFEVMACLNVFPNLTDKACYIRIIKPETRLCCSCELQQTFMNQTIVTRNSAYLFFVNNFAPKPLHILCANCFEILPNSIIHNNFCLSCGIAV